MGKLNKIYSRLFNSPRNYDEISFKRTKALLINTIIIGIISWIISLVIIVRDSSSTPISIDTEIQNTTTLPEITIYSRYTNIYAFSINNITIDQDFNQIDFSNYHHCIGEVPLSSSLCYNQINSNNNLTVLVSGTTGRQLWVQPFDLEYNENYLNINFQQLNISSGDYDYFSLGWVLVIDGVSYSFTGPIKVQVLLKKEIVIDSDGTQIINYEPNIVTSILSSQTCQSYFNGQIIQDCFENNLSVFYQTNIVTIYSKEKTIQLLLRIAKDIFSLSKFLLVLVSLVLSFLTTKFFFKKRTSWFENNIRDSVLYHFHYHELEPSLNSENKDSGSGGSGGGKNSSGGVNEINKNKKDGVVSSKKENRFIELKNKITRSIPYQDRYSKKLSLLSKIQWVVVGLSMLSISIVILILDFNVNVIDISYIEYDKLELPPFSFSYNSINDTSKFWYSWNEVYGSSSYNCTFDFFVEKSYICSSSYPPTEGAVPYLYSQNATYNNTNIQLSKGEAYSITITSFLIDVQNFNTTEMNAGILDKVYIKFYLNNVEYYIKPYSKITIELTKTTISQPYQDIISYEPSIIALPQLSEYVHLNGTYLGITEINIQYSTNIVKEVNMEGLFQKMVRLVSYIGSFISPVMIVVPFIFTKILSKLLYKNPSTHVDYDIREGILYHLYNYDKYKPIFKKNDNNKQSQKDLYSSKNFTQTK